MNYRTVWKRTDAFHGNYVEFLVKCILPTGEITRERAVLYKSGRMTIPVNADMRSLAEVLRRSGDYIEQVQVPIWGDESTRVRVETENGTSKILHGPFNPQDLVGVTVLDTWSDEDEDDPEYERDTEFDL